MPEFGHAAFLQSLGWALLNSIWQLAFLWVIYQVLFSFKTSSSPVLKSLTASLFLTSGFAWFLLTLFSHLFSGTPETILSSAFSAISGYAQMNIWLEAYLPVASVLYLLLLFIPLIKFGRNYRFVNKLRTQGQKKIDVEWRLFVQQVASRLGIQKPVSIFISDLVNSPVTIGFLKPLILVPIAAVNRLTPGQMEAILLHELAHIKRHDYLVNLWITFIQTILYFNPFVKLFIKQIEREREKSCDETVLHFQYDPHGYATALLMLEKTNSFTIALAAKGKKNDLLHRIETILGIEHSATPSLKKISGIFAGLVCIIAIQALFIMSKPQKEGSENFALLNATNPFYFFTGEQPANDLPLNMLAEKSTPGEVNKIENVIGEPAPAPTQPPGVPIPVSAPILPTEEIDNITKPDDYVYVSATEVIEPELTNSQEAQVAEILDASKIVLEKAKWIEIEKDIADALTSEQKQQLQNVYLAELDKINWEKMEDRLRHSIDNANLEKMSFQLQAELNQFKLDSLANEYSVAINILHSAEAFVRKNNQQEIIHPEISIPLLIEKRKALESELRKVKAIRDKKIIRL